MPLTDRALKALIPKAKPYIVSDGRGLYVEVLPTGGIAWRYRYRLNGRQEKVSLGRYPDVGLKVARNRRDELLTTINKGTSPAEMKRQERSASKAKTVRELAEEWYADQVLPNVKRPLSTRRYLNSAVISALGNKAPRDVTTADVQAIVFRKRDNGRPAAAQRVRQIIKQLFDYAIYRQVTTSNPAAGLPARFVAKLNSRDRYLTPDEIRTFLTTLYKSNVRRQFKLALHLLLLTLTRKGELLQARWEQVSFVGAEWLIPVENSKTGKPHVVYLSRQALDIFRELHALAGGSEWVLPGRSSLSKPFAHNALNNALKGLNFTMNSFTVHDLRRTGSTLLHEAGFPSDVIEKALNHVVGGVRGVYNKAEYAEKRREMLQFWADYVDDLANENKVVLGRFSRAA